MGSAVSAGPSAATIAASTSRAAATPVQAERQPRVIPAASTIVSASTPSTALAKKTATNRRTSRLTVSDVLLGRDRNGWLRRCAAISGELGLAVGREEALRNRGRQ